MGILVGPFDRSKMAATIPHFPVQAKRAVQKTDGDLWLQEGSRCSWVQFGEDKTVLDTVLTANQLSYYKTPEGIVDLNREGIEIALDRRIALFFQQTILCYRMPFVFSAKGADDQIGIAPKVTLHGQNQSVTYSREAAHSSTIPTLFARSKDHPEEGEFVYLKGGTSYAQHNATVSMHECINGADELIDGQGLRQTAVKILNQVADGLDPVKATRKFLDEFQTQIQVSLNSFKKVNSSSDRRKAVLQVYLEIVGEVRQRAAADKTLFDHWIGVVINPEDPKEPILREEVYKQRYSILQLQEVTESRIGEKVVALQKEMGSKERSFIELVVVHHFQEEKEKTILAKLFAKTAAQAYQGPKYERFKRKISKLDEKYREKLHCLMRDMRALFRELIGAEFIYRSTVFQSLRKRVREWTQKTFCVHYENKTGISISASGVSRLEEMARVPRKTAYKTPLTQRRKYISVAAVQNYAATLDVDVGHFLPCLFTS